MICPITGLDCISCDAECKTIEKRRAAEPPVFADAIIESVEAEIDMWSAPPDDILTALAYVEAVYLWHFPQQRRADAFKASTMRTAAHIADFDKFCVSPQDLIKQATEGEADD